MSVEIEKGIPMPETRGRKPMYPWENMDVGDSFLTEQIQAHRIAYVASKKYGKKFVARTLGGGKSRVWRVS